jgi:hypothetical protein
VSIRKNVDQEKRVDEVTTTQIIIVGNVMRFLITFFCVDAAVVLPVRFAPIFGNEGLSRLADRIDPFFVPVFLQFAHRT